MSHNYKKLSEALEHTNNLLNKDVKILKQENEQLNNLVETLKQEARNHAGEDDAHKSIQLEIYQAIGIQKGDWNGATPVIDKFNELKARVAELEGHLNRLLIHSEVAVKRMEASEIPYADVLSRIVKQTHKQSLAEHDAEDGREVLVVCARQHHDSWTDGPLHQPTTSME